MTLETKLFAFGLEIVKFWSSTLEICRSAYRDKCQPALPETAQFSIYTYNGLKIQTILSLDNPLERHRLLTRLRRSGDCRSMSWTQA